ncbi:replication protein RepA [Marinilactibacillus psychrotolerans]|uniref:replication initiator protein A n=1 Tax=Marinilactibacillus psychrotolerans TaxID=191770 RepID=UPI001C7C9F8E|nr:replication initiator protein A [Marinilactibacillus psychrotolerans]GEQ34156.1 replication protein RepA [Marinilactibacillus psychrotolerans]
MSGFNFYKADNVYANLFFRFPRALMYNEKYKDLSAEAKLAYMVLKDRLEYSLQNNWFDEDNNIFFIFTNKELRDLFSCSEHKAIKIKKELEQVNLLFQKKMGFDPKSKTNLPNRLYLGNLDVQATEVYIRDKKEGQTLDTSGTAKNAVRDDTAQTLDTSGTAKNAVRQKEGQTLDTNGTAKNAVNLYKESFKDIKDIKDSADYELQRKLIEKSINKTANDKTTENDLIEQYIDNHALNLLYGDLIISNIRKYSFGSFDTFVLYVSKMIFAHKAVEKELDFEFGIFPEVNSSAESMQRELSQVFWRCIQQARMGKTEKIDNYLFISFKNAFNDFGKTLLHRKEETRYPEVPLVNWLKNSN